MKTTLVTGGSRGIGKATVVAFLDKGYEVITTSTSGKIPLKNNNLTNYQLELGNRKSIKTLAEDLTKNKVSLDILINNAATADKNETKIDIQSLRNTLNTNVVGTIYLTQQLLALINKNGVIVNISSEFGSLTEDWGCRVPSYRIGKAAINMFTRNFYDCEEVKSKNIRVYSFDPGWVKTDMGGPHAEREPGEPAKEIVELVESGNPTWQFYRGLKARNW